MHCSSTPRGTIFSTVIFDFDGTLATVTIDFDGMKESVRLLAQKQWGGPLPVSSRPVLEWMESFALSLEQRDGPQAASLFLNQAHKQIRAFEVEAATRGKVFPHTIPVLELLEARGVGIGIITRNCTQAVEAVFPEIRTHCHCIITRDDIERVKPHPDHINQALHTLQGMGFDTRRDKVLMVGDHSLDVETGSAVGVATAGVASGNLSTLRLQQAGADMVADHCQELFECLDHRGHLPRVAR